MKIGMMAPNFEANSTQGKLKMSDFKGKWLVFFSHPADYTPVCTTEFLAFSKSFPAFRERNTNLLGLSIDSNYSHLGWLNEINKKTGVTVPFPVIADIDMKVAKTYDMISEYASDTSTVRNVYIIDPEQRIRAILIYPMNVGRNIMEIIRMVDALQLVDSKDVATPANWLPDMPVVLPAPTTYDDLVEREETNRNSIDWYLSFEPEE